MEYCKEFFLAVIKRIQCNRQGCTLAVLFFGVLLAYIYGSNIQNINTVWELPDEAGYLCNAAYFTGNDWSYVASRLPYYGYGYSVILIPLFYVCQSGVDMIQGAIFMNVICVLVSYFLQISVLSKICDKCGKTFLAFSAFVVSLQPYLMTNAFKVLCEVFLSMWVWLIALVLFKCLECGKLYMYIILGIVTGYIFFIHTRAIVIVGTVVVVLLLNLIKNRRSLRQAGVFAIALSAVFLTLYGVKQNLMTDSMQIAAGDVRADVNVMNATFIIQRLYNFAKDAYSYFIMFFGKILYLIATTCGMILFGLDGCLSGLKESYRSNDEKTFSLYFYIGGSIILMVAASTLGSSVASQNFTYIFYGRYYEYVLSPVFLLGLYTAVYGKISWKRCGSFLLITILTGIISGSARSFFLELDEIHIDTARISGFSDAVSRNSDYRSFIAYTTVFCTLLLVVEIGFARKRICTILIPVFVFIIMMQSSNKCLNKVREVNENQMMDWEAAEFVMENSKGADIIFVDSDYIYFGVYSRMQVLLKDTRLKIVQESEADGIEEGIYYLTYLSSSLGKRLEEEGKLVKKGADYGVYVN